MQALPSPVADGLQAYMNLQRQANAFYQAMEYHLLMLDYDKASYWAHEAAHCERHEARDIAYYLINRGIEPAVAALSAATVPGNDLLAIFRAAQALERNAAQVLDALYKTAESANDPETCEFLDHYLKGQLKEEAKLDKIIGWLERAGGDEAARLIIEKKIEKLA